MGPLRWAVRPGDPRHPLLRIHGRGLLRAGTAWFAGDPCKEFTLENRSSLKETPIEIYIYIYIYIFIYLYTSVLPVY
jgi:hypothetical protein